MPTNNISFIKHHPSKQLLEQHIEGKLPLSMALAVAAHIELCPHCQQLELQLTPQIANAAWAQSKVAQRDLEQDINVDACFSAMLSDITESSNDNMSYHESDPLSIECKGMTYTLPRAFTKFHQLNWRNLGKISRARLPFEEAEVRSSLLHIGKGGTIPTHTHKGYELTLLLAGDFEDENGHYVAGDFILLDESHSGHSPKTSEGCLCYTVSNAPLHFTQGVSQLFNSIGKVIY
ncbi:transcriptional regulator [Photobacterium angustum]|uniref:Transcriptional regulator n=1 Tax=Photobacterium angustum TaxID=661 RepID=A0A855SLB9_PHOAN|nr:ChrR family anti-sigma-E factor [Photobacterium angustum]KJF82489.1 transcriptional regulator [Photobacterium damselae subsp. damselae]KJG03379.1 transcriptional regulator [Photobacterium angustum]KJG18938.1 transcriptional regulator [Photobacterium angustum]KJG25370.1 transcriptional regulator [Photobacterium angustum]KJG33683.1 transcriptional regulator [Photobacterium angustum]